MKNILNDPDPARQMSHVLFHLSFQSIRFEHIAWSKCRNRKSKKRTCMRGKSAPERERVEKVTLVSSVRREEGKCADICHLG